MFNKTNPYFFERYDNWCRGGMCRLLFRSGPSCHLSEPNPQQQGLKLISAVLLRFNVFISQNRIHNNKICPRVQ